ncbi:hypothetical protein HOU00_gp088 [Caulobacter phage CcrPW]|uniref:Uncharacterized protein n=1 Tax=Caulobacter phage CcrPW TaxID=2283271 RepID=A0A385ECT4_9CAUD|nr:hypothetical protein HOU00_gp088 [Caulobacter phage CcrPW]AXQ68627.1 hypothetical protein CcrPW_gp088c [Caulobacter phage CcrPW]
MSRHFVQLTQADLPLYEGLILNPNGEKVIEISTTGEAGHFHGVLAPAKEVGDIVLIRFKYSNNVPAGQITRVTGLYEAASGPTFFRGDGLNVSGLQAEFQPLALDRTPAVALQFLGADWLILSKTAGVVPLT